VADTVSVLNEEHLPAKASQGVIEQPPVLDRAKEWFDGLDARTV
jgi:hypothetical protein